MADEMELNEEEEAAMDRAWKRVDKAAEQTKSEQAENPTTKSVQIGPDGALLPI